MAGYSLKTVDVQNEVGPRRPGGISSFKDTRFLCVNRRPLGLSAMCPLPEPSESPDTFARYSNSHMCLNIW